MPAANMQLTVGEYLDSCKILTLIRNSGMAEVYDVPKRQAQPPGGDQGSAVSGLALGLAIVVFGTHALRAQSAEIPKFDVASVKINKSNDLRPQAAFKAFPAAGRIVITGMTVRSVTHRAYGLQSFELVHDNNSVLNQR